MIGTTTRPAAICESMRRVATDGALVAPMIAQLPDVRHENIFRVQCVEVLR
jgi:hypothetical protein